MDSALIHDDWHDYLPSLGARGVNVTEELAKVAHLLSWYQRNEAIAERMALHVSKVKLLIHDLLVLLQVADRDAAAVVVRHAVETWRADRDRHSAEKRARTPAARPRRPGADADDRQDRRGLTPNG